MKSSDPIPEPGQLVAVRQRLYLVEQSVPPVNPGDSPLVRLSCIDDDAQGQTLDVLWDIELDARAYKTDRWHGLGTRDFDDPTLFAAYLNTLRWNCVTATDATLLQAPFRAGIRIETSRHVRNIRLAGIHCPERKQDGGPDATRFTAGAAMDRDVTVAIFRRSGDICARPVAIVSHQPCSRSNIEWREFEERPQHISVTTTKKNKAVKSECFEQFQPIPVRFWLLLGHLGISDLPTDRA